MKILSILLILVGLSGLINKQIIFGFVFILLGALLLQIPKKETDESIETDIKKIFTFIVDISYEARQNTFKKLIKDWKECNPADYDEKTKEDNIKVCDIDIENWCDIKLVPEPGAIKVMSEYGIMGYIPSRYTSKVKAIIDNEYDLNWKFINRNYKYYDYDEIITENLTYGIEITLIY